MEIAKCSTLYRVQVETPTESRPCHVSMFAGFREDPTNLYNGWTKNEKKFDSIFNRSTNAYMFGSVDIIELFDDYGKENHIHSYTYDLAYPKAQYLDKSYLDKWVLKKFKTFLNHRPEENPNTIYFFHLMGSDTNGHKHGAESKVYRNNVIIVDDIINEIETLFNRYYKGTF